MITVSTSGFRELDKALAELPKATARNVLNRALRKAAEPIADEARRQAPEGVSRRRRIGKKKEGEKRGEGKFRWHEAGTLKKSIAVSTRLKNKVGGAEFAAVLRGGGTKADAVKAMRNARRNAPGGTFAEVFVGPARGKFVIGYAHLVEFGTAKAAPQPFMRPAWDAKKNEALAIIRRELGNEIIMAARRIGRSKKKSVEIKYRASIAALLAVEAG